MDLFKTSLAMWGVLEKKLSDLETSAKEMLPPDDVTNCLIVALLIYARRRVDDEFIESAMKMLKKLEAEGKMPPKVKS